MSFFKKIFTKNKNEVKTSEPIKRETESNQTDKVFTNFSEYGLPDIEFSLIGNPALDLMATIGRLDTEMKNHNVPFKVKGFYFTKLYDEGALRIPVVFNYNNKGYSLFYIYDDEQATAFNSAKDLIKDSDYPNALFISKTDCSNVKDKSDCLTSFSLSDLSYNETPELKGEYAMWHSDKHDSTFYKSVTNTTLLELYECIKGYESYIFGYLLSEIKMKGFEEFKRVSLPSDENSFVVKGPEYNDIIISVSQEKGIRFQFHRPSTTHQYRERLLKQILSSLKAFQVMLTMKQMPKDEELDENGYDWYTFMARVIEKQEKEGQINGEFVIGGISFD